MFKKILIVSPSTSKVNGPARQVSGLTWWQVHLLVLHEDTGAIGMGFEAQVSLVLKTRRRYSCGNQFVIAVPGDGRVRFIAAVPPACHTDSFSTKQPVFSQR